MSYKRITSVPVTEGGTGIAATTAYAPLCGGTTGTAALQTASTGISNSGYVLTSTGAGSLPTWQAVAGGGGVVTLTADTGSATGGTIALAGTANEITTTASGATVTFSIPSTFTPPGSLTVTSGFTVSAGTITLTPLNASGMVVNDASGVISTTATTNHNVQIGNSSGQLTSVAPSSTAGIPLISEGSSADPAFGTAVVAGGGTGNTTFTAYSLICAGTTATGAFQNVVGLGASGQILTSNGAGALPSWGSAGVTSIAGTANQITASASTGAVTLSIPSSFIAPGSVTVTSGFTVSAGTTTITPLNAQGIVLNDASGVLSTTATTQYAVQVGNSTGQLASISPSATSGIPLVSQGAAANPAYSTAVVAGGGTGNTTFTAYSVLCAGTTATGAFQNVSGLGSSGQVLTSNGAGALPTWQNAGGGGGGVTSITGTSNQITASAMTGAVTLSIPNTFIAPASIASTTSLTAGNALTVTAGAVTITPFNASGVVVNSSSGVLSTSATTNHAVQVGNSSGQLTSVTPSSTSGVPLISQGSSANPTFGTAVVAGGGTGATSFTAYSVLCGGTTSTGAVQNVSGVGTTGQVLTSNGASALPTWQAPASSALGVTSMTATSSTSVSMTTNSGYISTAATTASFLLPATSSVGDTIIILNTDHAYQITQASGQQIFSKSSNTTLGATGFVNQSSHYCGLQLFCITANTTWVIGWYGGSSISFS